MAGLVGAGMELVTRLPGGDLIVFGLAIVISWTAFMARRWETRRLLPPEALESAPICQPAIRAPCRVPDAKRSGPG